MCLATGSSSSTTWLDEGLQSTKGLRHISFPDLYCSGNETNAAVVATTHRAPVRKAL